MNTTVIKSFLALGLLFVAVPAYSELPQYKSVKALLEQFADFEKCKEGTCTDFLEALKNFVANDPNPKFKQNRAKYDKFFSEIEAKIKTRKATMIALCLLQGKELFPEVTGLLKGRTKDQINDIIKQRLNAPSATA